MGKSGEVLFILLLLLENNNRHTHTHTQAEEEEEEEVFTKYAFSLLDWNSFPASRTSSALTANTHQLGRCRKIAHTAESDYSVITKSTSVQVQTEPFLFK